MKKLKTILIAAALLLCPLFTAAQPPGTPPDGTGTGPTITPWVGGDIPRPVSNGGVDLGGPVIDTTSYYLDALAAPDLLRELALDSVVVGRRHVFAESMDQDFTGQLTTIEARGNSAEEVLGKLFKTQFRYRLKNPDDELDSYVYLYDEGERNVIVYSNTRYKASDASGEVGPKYPYP